MMMMARDDKLLIATGILSLAFLSFFYTLAYGQGAGPLEGSIHFNEPNENTAMIISEVMNKQQPKISFYNGSIFSWVNQLNLIT